MRFFKKKEKEKKKEKKSVVNVVEGLVCYCFRIYEDEIIDIIKKNNCTHVEDVQRYCSASQGCGGCRMDIEELLEKNKISYTSKENI